MSNRISILITALLLFPCINLVLGQGNGVYAFEETILQARPLPLGDVRLTGGPLKHAQDLDAKYLLELEPDRMLAYYREQAGLKRKAEPYGGWDGGGRNLTGHIAGHYLSAVSLMYQATGDPRFKARADYIVSELKTVQDANGDGYLGALEGLREAFQAVSKGDIRSGGFDLNGLWSPWYTLHKTYAGLRDAYRYTGNKTALELEVKYAEWAERQLAPMTDEQIQRMLRTEFGGMNEVFVDLYADTGDKRWLDLSYKFEDVAFITPLQRHQDYLDGKHGNTQIPKLIGSLDRFAYVGKAADLVAASYFWDEVVRHHSYATGGHSKDEYFGAPGKLNDRVDGRTAETCNVYNMLKLGRRLFSFQPDAHYADFQERALFNHILGSIDDQGATSYMTPVGRSVRKEYADMLESFTCCVGTGMESHALHGDGIYHESKDKLWVNIYAPSTAKWATRGIDLSVETDFPEGESAKLTIHTKKEESFVLALRRPYWVTDGFSVRINGEVVPVDQKDKVDPRGGWWNDQSWREGVSSYVELNRTWKGGDVVEIALPKVFRVEAVPDNPRRVALMWGPLVLAGDLGPEPEWVEGKAIEEPVSPVLVAAGKPLNEWIQPVDGKPGTFRTVGVGREPDEVGRMHDVDLVPFYRLHRRTYSAYWDLFTEPEWEQQQAAYAAEAARRRRLEAATVAYAQPGEMQPERDFNYQGAEDAQVQRIEGRAGRSARSWFSFDMPVEQGHPLKVLVTYFSQDRRNTPASFDILVDDTRIATQQVARSEPSAFYETAYAIPDELVRGKKKITIRFQAAEGNRVATVFGLRMIRADAEL